MPACGPRFLHWQRKKLGFTSWLGQLLVPGIQGLGVSVQYTSYPQGGATHKRIYLLGALGKKLGCGSESPLAFRLSSMLLPPGGHLTTTMSQGTDGYCKHATVLQRSHQPNPNR